MVIATVHGCCSPVELLLHCFGSLYGTFGAVLTMLMVLSKTHGGEQVQLRGSGLVSDVRGIFSKRAQSSTSGEVTKSNANS